MPQKEIPLYTLHKAFDTLVDNYINELNNFDGIVRPKDYSMKSKFEVGFDQTNN